MVIYIETAYVSSMYKKKGYCKLLVSLSILFANPFVHTRKCDHSNYIGVEPVRWMDGYLGL